MSSQSDDLISLWLSKHKQNGESKGEPNVKSPIPKRENTVSDQPEPSANIAHLTPLLGGRLAEYLASQEPRTLTPSEAFSTNNQSPWTIDNLQTKAAVAMSLVLASHLTRFSGTILSEQHLIQARDAFLHTFSAKDAVKIEVEAYDLLNWFAGAMNENWQLRTPDVPSLPNGETSEMALIQIISNAIEDKHDLMMRYYTGSRGEFSERRITPIEITAEKYLIAFCHLRDEERVFRLSRIVQLTPILMNEEDASKALCYPNAQDTKLPPLPESKEQKKPATRTRKTSNKGKKEPNVRQETNNAPSLFDFDNTKKKKTEPKKKSQERSLFDDYKG